MTEAVLTPAEPPSVDAEPRWLTEEEQDAWRSLATLMLMLSGPLDAQLQRDSRMSLFEYLVLSHLSHAPDRRLRMSELAQLANGSLSRLSNVVKRLEERGWVHRQVDSGDGRYTVASLTDEGFAILAAAAPGHVQAVRHYAIDPLTTTQLRTITAVGHRIRERLRTTPGTDGCC